MTAQLIAFQATCELLNARWASDDGRTVEFRICGEAYERMHPFKQFTKRRNGRVGTRFSASIAAEQTGEMTYVGQAMLASWGDNSTNGQHFKLWLDDESARHPFAGFSRRKGQTPGDLFAVVLVEVDDDETPINQETRQRAESLGSADPGGEPNGAAGVQAQPETDAQGEDGEGKIGIPQGREWSGVSRNGSAGHGEPRQGAARKPPIPKPRKPPKLSQDAWRMVTGPRYVRWLEETRAHLVKAWTPDLAKAWTKQILDIESLSDLDRDGAAVKRFHEKIRRPYETWANQEPP